jgi:vacuolar protein sorting-associated protein 13D
MAKNPKMLSTKNNIFLQSNLECNEDDIVVGGCVVRLQPKQMLEEKCELKLQVERNLDKTFCHRVPDLSIKGGLSKVHATVDTEQVFFFFL